MSGRRNLKATRAIPGDFNARCDRCGFRMKGSEALTTWDEMKVHKECFEVRHPQDFLMTGKEKHDLQWTKPETDILLQEGACDPAGRQGIIGVAVVGCAVIGLNFQTGLDNTDNTDSSNIDPKTGMPPSTFPTTDNI